MGPKENLSKDRMVATRSMRGNGLQNDEVPSANPMALMMDTRKEFESMKHKNVEEIKALRVENEMMKKKLKMGHTPTIDENLRGREQSGNKTQTYMEENSSRPNHTNFMVSSRATRKLLRKHPLIEAIMEVSLSVPWINPTIEKYDDSLDPDDHVDAYMTKLNLYTTADELFCRVFHISLKGTTLNWFTCLPPFSVYYFDTLVSKFSAQFVTSKFHHLTSLALINIQQERPETLRSFMDRFRKVAFDIRDLSLEGALHHLVTSLKPGPFSDSFFMQPAKSMDELRHRVAKFMQLKEMREFKRGWPIDLRTVGRNGRYRAEHARQGGQRNSRDRSNFHPTCP